MSQLTRAEAVCALRNLVEAIEALDEILPADFSKGVHERSKSMLDTVLSKPQYDRVTENQDRAIRNMWTAIQKWNRKGQANRDMFYGLADVQHELTEARRAPVAAESAQEPPDRAEPEEPEDDLPEGLEDAQSFADSMMAGLTVPKAPPRPAPPPAPPPAPAKFVQPGKPVTAPPAQPEPARLMELIAKARENVIAWVYNRFKEKNIRVIDMDKIKHGDISPVLKMTTSDRNQQLIDAAWLAGYVSGAKGASEELQELLKKE